ncbi:c-type cytochrome [Mangrovicoccus sp. HB161399]|uniref:c-type cytochrome n=1 Tax=Mangrovicoccus sp. HB161399 TaxID=2720392 RepID=UPI001553F640|nr:c-type cytochrome [Mangrovicoccus sp. HB161399]
MSKWVEAGLAVLLLAGPAAAEPLGLGRPALPEEIAAWDMTVLPDGTGLPEGSGDVWTGDEVFAENCAMCHGDFAEGLDNWPVLAGGAGSLQDRRPVKTIGSYWPHLSTVWDYVHRSMPFGMAQTLTPDDVYAITAFLLYSNGMVEDDFVLSKENFAEIAMPNAGGFYPDDRPETEYPEFTGDPCMSACAAGTEITKRAVKLNVTPVGPDGRPAGTLPDLHLAAAGTAAPAMETSEPEAPAETVTLAAAEAADPALVEAGGKVFKKCQACHKVGEGAKNATGPELNGILGRPVGSVDGFRYSSGMEALGSGGAAWDHDLLAGFLAKPKDVVKGTKMGFAGLKKDADIEAVIAYLSTFPAE